LTATSSKSPFRSIIILATALPIRPNPLIPTFVAIRKSPSSNTPNAVSMIYLHITRENHFIYDIPTCQDFIAGHAICHPPKPILRDFFCDSL
jgi:hypothetical protein